MREHFNILKRQRTDKGFTLVEILVAISLLAIVVVLVTSLVNSTMNSASRFSNVTTTQGQVSNALNQMQKDFSSASKVTRASNNSVSVVTRENGKDVTITYFAHVPGKTNVPAGVTVTNLPDFPALIQVREGQGVTGGSSVVVKGLDLSGFADADKRHLFDYFDKANGSLDVPTSESGEAATTTTLKDISRIQFRLSAKAEGRGTPVQLESSAAVNSSSAVADSGIPGAYDGVPECPANFTVSINPSSAPQTATLEWYSPQGTTSYTIYGTDVSRSEILDPIVIADPTQLSHTITNLKWGTTYSWSIQASGPNGTSGACSPTVATVIPAEIGFANVNSLADLSRVKSGTTTENITRPAETGIPAKTVATTDRASGLRYTVARDLQNQLAWTTSYGVVGYRVYAENNLNTPLATITSAGTQYHRFTTEYGDVRSYVVRAYNAGGESYVSEPITLVSPPSASSASATDPDTSTRSTTTDSRLTISSRAANTDGFRFFKSEGTVASNVSLCSPATWNPVPSMNFSGGAANSNDATAAWGTTSCYQVVGFNDAGPGEPSTTSVMHRPGKFSILNADNEQTMRVIDTNRDVNGNAGALYLPWCWVNPAGGVNYPVDMNCKGGIGHRPDAYYALGMFGTADNQYTQLALRWDPSHNAFKNYSVTRDRIASSSQRVDQTAAKVITNNAPYVAGTPQGIKYYYEMPGSIYQFTITARAQNDLTRARTTQMLSKPDIPHHMRGNYYIKNFGSYNGSRISLNVHVSAVRGMSDSIETQTMMNGQGWKYEARGISNSYENFSSNYQTVPGVNYRYVTTILNRNLTIADGLTGSRTVNVQARSDMIGRAGYLTGFVCPPGPGSCYDADGKPQVDYGYPPQGQWWTGASSRYWSGGAANNGYQVVSSTVPTPIPDGPALNEEDKDNTCVAQQEDSSTFTRSCTYGEGIPPSPTLTATQSGTTQNITWNAWDGVTGYNVTYSINGGSPVSVERAATNRTLALTVPVGQSATINVEAFNNVAFSTNPGSLTVATAPAVPTNVTATVNNDVATVKWTASTGATRYVVQYTNGSLVYNVNVTSPTATLSGLLPGQWQIRVKSAVGTAESAFSAVRLITVAQPTGPQITGLTVYEQSGQWHNVDFNHSGGDVTYRLQVTGPGGTVDYGTYRVSGTAKKVQYFTVPLETPGQYTFTLSGVATGQTNPVSTVTTTYDYNMN